MLLHFLSASLALVPALGAPLAPRSSTGATTDLSLASNSTNSTSSRIAATWYAGYHSDDFPVQNVSWTKYTHAIYAFAATAGDGSMVALADSDAAILPSFVELAHDNGVKAMLSVGGFDGSLFFSSGFATDANRTAFVNAVLNLTQTYNLDGIDFDWEFPNADGVGCNTRNASDSSNFLTFLQALRAEPAGANLTLSAATNLNPWLGADGNPLSNVSSFANELDFISIMNYDVFGPFSTTTGPNAPLNDTCAPASSQQGSAVSALNAWTAAGFPASQIVLGVPAYGHSYRVNNTDALVNSTTDGTQTLALYTAFDKANEPHGDKWDSDGTGTDVCGNPNVVGGVFTFWGMIEGGFLDTNGTVTSGMVSLFDDCSQTPFVYDPSTEVMISYDDATSFAAKGKFIADNNLAGFAMFETGGDSDDILLDSIRAAMLGEDDDDTDDC